MLEGTSSGFVLFCFFANTMASSPIDLLKQTSQHPETQVVKYAFALFRKLQNCDLYFFPDQKAQINLKRQWMMLRN